MSEKYLDLTGLSVFKDKMVELIPTKTSDLTNDSGFITSHQDISGKVDKTGDTMTGTLSVPNITMGNISSGTPGTNSFIAGQNSLATGNYSFAIGDTAMASGNYAFASGAYVTASSNGAHAEGIRNTTTCEAQHIQGKWSINNDTTLAHVVGNGAYQNRSNCHTLAWDGTAWFAGDVYVGSTGGKNKDSGSKKLATTDLIPTNNNQLTNGAGYQTASDVSTAIGEAIAGITGISYEIVQTLPATGSSGVIYLISNSGSSPNIYDEYIWVNNAFEKIGTTEVDLTDYMKFTDMVAITTSEINALFA